MKFDLDGVIQVQKKPPLLGRAVENLLAGETMEHSIVICNGEFTPVRRVERIA